MYDLTKEDIIEYQKIMKNDYGIDMAPERAEEHGLWLLRLCEVLFVKENENGRQYNNETKGL